MDPIIGVLVLLIILAVGYFLIQQEPPTQAPPTAQIEPPTYISPPESTEQISIPDTNCVQSEWGACDAQKLIQTRSVLTPQSGNGTECGPSTQQCLLPPKLQSGALQWQYNCPRGGDCSGLVWNSVGKKPWNKYYKLSCQNKEVESPMVGPFGPVTNNNYNNPKLRLGPNGKNNGCNPNNTNIYRSTIIDGQYTKLDPSKLGGFNGGQWDGRDAIFVDLDNSEIY